MIQYSKIIFQNTQPFPLLIRSIGRSTSTGKLWINRRELTARDFSPDEGFQSGGILCVFPALETAQLGKKIRCSAEDNLFRDSKVCPNCNRTGRKKQGVSATFSSRDCIFREIVDRHRRNRKTGKRHLARGMISSRMTETRVSRSSAVVSRHRETRRSGPKTADISSKVASSL